MTRIRQVNRVELQRRYKQLLADRQLLLDLLARDLDAEIADVEFLLGIPQPPR